MAPSDPACFHAAIVRTPVAVPIMTWPAGTVKCRLILYLRIRYTNRVRARALGGPLSSDLHAFRECHGLGLRLWMTRHGAGGGVGQRAAYAEELLADGTVALVANLTHRARPMPCCRRRSTDSVVAPACRCRFAPCWRPPSMAAALSTST